MRQLECRSCGRRYDEGADAPWRCECGHALDVANPPIPDRPQPDPGSLDTRRGLWTFSSFLPVGRNVTLGEGMTPLVEAPAWDAAFKLEYVFPTGSFKDRGACLSVSRAVSNGVDRVLEDSSGNAGQAIATYAARAGLDARIYVPADAKAAKLRAIEAAGAEIVRIEGDRTAVTRACVDAVESGEGWYASHAWDPAFYAGTATVAYEMALQRDWSAPDAVVIPVGHGTLLLGAYRGFRALEEAGWIESMPRLLAAQAAGHAPIVTALRNDTAATGTNELADGIQIEAPARRDQVTAAIEATDGDAIAIGAEEVEVALTRLHEEGFYTEPTSAVAPAALEAYREQGILQRDADVVVPLTGSGLKD
jgi:threonine synthase